MACRSVNNLRLSKDELRRAFKSQACGSLGGARVGGLFDVLDVLVPIIIDFLKKRPYKANMYGAGYLGRDRDVPYHGHVLGLESGSNDDSGHCAEDFANLVMSEEEFEGLLKYAQECNVKLY